MQSRTSRRLAVSLPPALRDTGGSAMRRSVAAGHSSAVASRDSNVMSDGAADRGGVVRRGKTGRSAWSGRAKSAGELPHGASPGDGHDPYLSLRFRDFRLLLAGVFISSFGQQ